MRGTTFAVTHNNGTNSTTVRLGAFSVVLDPAPLPAVLLVSQGNPYLERLLQVLPVARAVETRTADPSRQFQ